MFGRHKLLIAVSVLLAASFHVKNLDAQENNPEVDRYRIIALLIQEESYEQALERLENDRSALADLMRAKVLYRQQDYSESVRYLTRVQPFELPASAYAEAMHVKLLCYIHLELYSDAFRTISEVAETLPEQKDTLDRVKAMYSSLLGFLSLEQRKDVLKNSSNARLATDIIQSAIYRVPASELSGLLDYAIQLGFTIDASVVRKLNTALRSQELYEEERSETAFSIPKGLNYHLSFLLPLFEKDQAEFSIIQGIYNGFKLAIDRYNNNNPDNQLYLKSINTLQRNELKSEWTKMIVDQKADFIIGPLFSEVLGMVTNFDNPNNTPLFAPLANTADYSSFKKWIYQINPEFRTRGRKAATYLKTHFDLDSVLVIAERGSLGEISAEGFRTQAIQDSIHISKYLVEDFASEGYDIRPYAIFFTTDSLLQDSLNITPFQAVYAPLSGATSETMIRFLMTALESNNNYPLILGSGEWDAVELTGLQRSRFEIWYDSFQLMDTQREGFNDFIDLYEQKFGIAPNQQAILGFDLGRYLTQLIERYKNPDIIIQEIQRDHYFKGISVEIDFQKSRINNHLFYLQKD